MMIYGKNKLNVLALGFVTACGLIATPTQAQLCIENESAKLLGSDGGTGDQFGWSVAMEGNTAIIGAPFDFSTNGSAYVFEFDGVQWNELVKLRDFGQNESERRFGRSVALSGDTILVGAPNWAGTSNRGRAWVFRFDGSQWLAESMLELSASSPNDQFGYSVAIDGDTAVIGAPFNTYCNQSGGSAYVFRRSGTQWTQQAMLCPSIGAVVDQYGTAVSVKGNTIVVGAPGNGSGALGGAHIYRYNGAQWIDTIELLSSDGASGGEFGVSVALGGITGNDLVLVGAPTRFNTGAVYVFDAITGQQVVRILPTSGGQGNRFGKAVGLRGTTAIIGFPWGPDSGTGAAYIYEATSGALLSTLMASDGQLSDGMGWGVAISGNHAIAGARLDDDLGDRAGSAYAFDVDTNITPCSVDLTHDCVLDFFDVQAFLDAFANSNPIADLTGDGLFDFFDVQAFLQAFSDGCP
jgi:FG-GAP repeat protein